MGLSEYSPWKRGTIFGKPVVPPESWNASTSWARPAGDHRHPRGPAGARDRPSLGAVTPFLYWMQVAIVVLVIASAVIAIVKL